MKIEISCPNKDRQESLKREFEDRVYFKDDRAIFTIKDINIFGLQMFHAGISHGFNEASKIVKLC